MVKIYFWLIFDCLTAKDNYMFVYGMKIFVKKYACLT